MDAGFPCDEVLTTTVMFRDVIVKDTLFKSTVFKLLMSILISKRLISLFITQPQKMLAQSTRYDANNTDDFTNPESPFQWPGW